MITNKIRKEVFDFLDILRQTGVTNMFGALPYLRDSFPELTKKECSQLLMEWMLSK